MHQLAGVLQRGAEHFEKKGAREQRRALAKINQGDFRDAQKHQFKAQRAAERAHALRPPTPTPVMAPAPPPPVVAHQPHHPIGSRPSQQNLQGCNFGGLGGGLGVAPMPAHNHPQHHKPHHNAIPQQQMPPQMPLHSTPIQHQNQHHIAQTPIHTPQIGAPQIGMPVQAHPQHNQAAHAGGAAHKVKMNKHHHSGMSGTTPQPLVGPPIVSDLVRVDSQAQLMAHNYNHSGNQMPVNPQRFSGQMQNPPPPLLPNKENVMPVAPQHVIGGGVAHNMGLKTNSTHHLQQNQIPVHNPNAAHIAHHPNNHHKQNVRKEQKQKIIRPQPPPPAPSTIATTQQNSVSNQFTRPQHSSGESVSTLNFSETPNNKILIPEKPAESDALQLVKKW